MQGLSDIRAELALFLPLATATLAVLAWRGCFTPYALNMGPQRHTSLTLLDLLAALALMLAGMTLTPYVLESFDLAPGDASLSAHDLAMRQGIAQLVIQLPAVVYVIWRVTAQSKGLTELGATPRHPLLEGKYVALGLLAILPLYLGVNVSMTALLLLWGVEVPQLAHAMLEPIREAYLQGQRVPLLLLLGSVLVLAPVFEEVIFRGLAQSAMSSVVGPSRRWAALVPASLLFTLVHVGPGFANAALPALFVLAMGLGWLYERTGSLWPPILVHSAFNALNVAVALWLVGPA